MYKLYLIFIILIFTKQSISQILNDSTFYYFDILKYDNAISYLKKNIKQNNYKNDVLKKEIDWYNLACAYALKKDSKKCIETLNTSIKNNSDLKGFDKDPDFYNVTHTKEWNLLLLNYKKKNNINLLDTIYSNLSQISINDQAFYREIAFYEKKYGKNSSKVKLLWHVKDSLNKVNLKLVLNYLEKGYNVLSDSVVGAFSNKCFLVIQHSDIETMEKLLPTIKDLYDRKHTSGGNYALLFDRVAVDKNKGVQYYGTQINPETNQPFLIKDEKNVDKRREELGMESMVDYCRRFQIIYNPKRKK